MNCPKCNNPMKNLGNLSGFVYTSYPPCWDETWVCHNCELKKTVREHGKLPDTPPDISDYEDVC